MISLRATSHQSPGLLLLLMPALPAMAPPGDGAAPHSRIWQHCEATDRTHHINTWLGRISCTAPRMPVCLCLVSVC